MTAYYEITHNNIKASNDLDAFNLANDLTYPSILWDQVSEEDYYINSENNLKLIIPKDSKIIWSEEDRYYRSLLVNDKDEIVSSGFEKFFRYGLYEDVDQEITRVILNRKPCIFYEKIDGSLIIRDVIDNKVNFRTRGNHTLGDFENDVMELVHKEYPLLLEPNIMSKYSVLMEFVHPDHRIVVDYQYPELYALGAVYKTSGFKYPKLLDCKDDLNELFGIRKPKAFDLSQYNTIEEIVTAVSNIGSKGSCDTEGFVVWFTKSNGELGLVKIKTDEYLRRHYQRSLLTDKYIRIKMYNKLYSGVPYEDLDKSIVSDHEFDEELLPEVSEIVLCNLKRLAIIYVNMIDLEIKIFGDMITIPSRKGKIEYIKSKIEEHQLVKLDFNKAIDMMEGNLHDYIWCEFFDMNKIQYQTMKKLGIITGNQYV